MKTPATIPNWDKYQHYTDRRPPWIKLHRALLDDFDFWMLPTCARAMLPMLWLLACEGENGSFDADPQALAFRFRLDVSEVKEALNHLMQAGWVQVASGVLADCKRDATTEREAEAEAEERERTRAKPARAGGKRNKYPEDFERWWQAMRPWYIADNRTIGYKVEAFAVWKKRKFTEAQVETLIRRAKKQRQHYEDCKRSSNGRKGIGPQDPHRYLKNRRYNDEVPS